MRTDIMDRSGLRKPFTWALLGRVLILSAIGTRALSATAAAAEYPNFSGLWAKTTDSSVERSHMSPLTPEGERLYARNKKGIAETDPEIDKRLTCFPNGFPLNTMGIQPLGIFQSQKALAMVGEPTTGVLHIVYIDASHVSGLPPQIEGDAVGHWEGDTLVVDTTNIYDGTFMDGTGIPHSKVLHVVQRLRLVDGGKTLEEMLLIEDPVIFTKPWSATFDFVRTNFQPPEKFCNEARNAP